MSGAAGSSQWMYASGDYEIDQSLRFNDDDSAYLSKTFASEGNRRTWTASAWVKRSSLGSIQYIWACTHTDDSIDLGSYFGSNDRLYLTDGVQGGGVLQTTQVFRDTSAWLHIVWALDTTQSTVDNRIKIYVNGVQVTDFANNAISSGISQNEEMAWMSADKEHRIGRRPENNTSYLDGYIAEFNFVDGLVKAPADFGETGTYGEWKPKEYSGSYGYKNGFYLNFAGGGIISSATGGNSTGTTSDYKYKTYTSNGTFTPSDDGTVEYLVVGGGGGGGSKLGGGGGGGGFRAGFVEVTGSTAYTVTVGAGGAYDADGSDSSISGTGITTITATGGGHGGAGNTTAGSSGGSGGGGAGITSGNTTGGAGTSGQGKSGGDGAGSNGFAGGGGGGAGAAGADGPQSGKGGDGGAGLRSNIDTNNYYYSGGGGGGAHFAPSTGAGDGGIGGGGGGARGGGSTDGGTHGNGTGGGSARNSGGSPADAVNQVGGDGGANTGGGGGGAPNNANAGGAGGSGIVIIRYKFQ